MARLVTLGRDGLIVVGGRRIGTWGRGGLYYYRAKLDRPGAAEVPFWTQAELRAWVQKGIADSPTPGRGTQGGEAAHG